MAGTGQAFKPSRKSSKHLPSTLRQPKDDPGGTGSISRPHPQQGVEFRFLHCNPVGPITSEQRKLIRSHVTRHQRRKARTMTAAGRKSRTIASIQSAGPEAPKFTQQHTSAHLSPTESREYRPPTPPAEIRGQPLLLRSTTVPTGALMKDRQSTIYLECYLRDIASAISGLPVLDAIALLRDVFVPFVRATAVSRHTTTLVAVSYASRDSLFLDNTDVLRLQEKAYCEVASAISDPSRVTSDHMILGVAQLALYEARVGNGSQYRVHKQALKDLLPRRDGFSMFGLQDVLFRIVHWIDHTASTLIENENKLKGSTLAQ